MKNFKRHWLIPLFTLQIAGTGYTISEQFYTQKKGQTYRFQTKPIDPRDPFRGQYVALNFDIEKAYPFAACIEKNTLAEKMTVYATFTKNDKGMAHIADLTLEKPAHNDYLTLKNGWCGKGDEVGKYHLTLPFDRYYANEDEAYELEKTAREKPETTYLEVRVYAGSYSVGHLILSSQ